MRILVTYLFFVVVSVDFCETQIFDFLLAHQVVLHAALEVRDLELLAPLRHQLVLVEAGIVSDSVLLALVEVIQWETALIWGDSCHSRSSVN